MNKQQRLEKQRMMMIGGVTEGGMKERRKEECSRCFPLFKASSNFSQPDVLHQRFNPSSGD